MKYLTSAQVMILKWSVVALVATAIAFVSGVIAFIATILITVLGSLFKPQASMFGQFLTGLTVMFICAVVLTAVVVMYIYIKKVVIRGDFKIPLNKK